MARFGLLAQEVIQTSAMDCGPAAVKCLIAGYGIQLDYDRVREACRTGVDGTSIDSLQDLVLELGLPASQHVVPREAVATFLGARRPFMAVVRTAYGGTHFEVVWRRFGSVVQTMDPNVGRRWRRTEDYLDGLLVHEHAVAASDWVALAMSGELHACWLRRLVEVGVDGGASVIGSALQTHGWRGLSALDAALRIVERLGEDRACAPNAAAFEKAFAVAIEALLEPDDGCADALPHQLFCAWPAAAIDGVEHIRLRGVVLLAIDEDARPAFDPRHSPQLGIPGASENAPDPRELVVAAANGPWRTLWELVGPELRWPLVFAGIAAVIFSAGVIMEWLVFRSTFALAGQLRGPLQLWGYVGAICAFLSALVIVQTLLAATSLWAGRLVEGRLHVALLEKLPRLTDAFFRSRSISDLARRAQSLDTVRRIARSGFAAVQGTMDLIVTAVAIALLDPGVWMLAVGSAVLAIGVPWAMRSVVFEREARVMSQLGALSTSYLDVLRGLVPCRTHHAEHALRVEHDNLLVGWYEAFRSQGQLAYLTRALQSGIAAACIIAIVFAHVAGSPDAPHAILLFFWAQRILLSGDLIVRSVREVGVVRGTLQRVLEPLQARERTGIGLGEAGAPVAGAHSLLGIAIELRGVCVEASGHPILEEIDLSIGAGERIAIVGRSGAGKSSLIGVLLGWHACADGRATMDGHTIDERLLERLRPEIAWVDPAVHLWNASMAENLGYGADPHASRAPADVIQQADLLEILERLPQGLQTGLGESGGLVSGGEGQRVRLGRVMTRRHARLVLLDEPFRGLDRERRRELLGRVLALWPGATLVCVTHDVRETVDFPRVLVVEDGRLLEDGAPAALLATSSRYRALVEADRRIQDTVWGGHRWRRTRLLNGTLVEQSAPRPATPRLEVR